MLSARKPKVIATNIITPNATNSSTDLNSNTNNRPTHASKRSIGSSTNPTIRTLSPPTVARSTTSTPGSVTSNTSVKNIPLPKARITNPQNLIRSNTSSILLTARQNGATTHSSPSTVRRGPRSEVVSTSNSSISSRSLLFSPPPPNAFPTIQPDDLMSNVSSSSAKTDHSGTSEAHSIVSSSSHDSQASNDTFDAQEARTNRRILDLEISNKSLLLINHNLEQKLKQQALEIENLKNELNSAHSKQNVSQLELEEASIHEVNNEIESESQFNRLFSICNQLVADGELALSTVTHSSGTKVITVLPPELASDGSLTDPEEDPSEMTPVPQELTFTSIDTAALHDEVD